VVNEDQSLEDAFELMERHQVKRLPVVRNKRLVGMLSRRDLLRAAVDMADTASI
jgi:CBS domain-containing protein